VFDGGAWPPNEIGILRTPVRFDVKNGVVTDISGDGADARVYADWMAALKDPNMYRVAHWSLGFNPGVRQVTGRIVEDERVFGCVELGFGTKGSWIGGEHWVAAAHTDASIVAPSIYIDGVAMEENGRYVHPEIVGICRQMNIEGY